MKVWSFFDPATGHFTGQTYAGDDEGLDLNLPSGLDALPGVFDHLAQRIEDGAVVEYQPPQPSAEHEWNPATRRWQLTAAAQASADQDAAARAAIQAAEAGSDRAIREALLLLLPQDAPERQRLQAVDDAIAAQRPKLKKG